MRNGYHEVYELELATTGRGDRDGRAGARAIAGRRFSERMEAESRARRAAWARRVALEETKSLCRRAERAQVELLLQESRGLRALAELRLAARHTTGGQLLAAGLL